MKHIVILVLTVVFSSMVFGAVANPEPFFVQQPDGQTIKVIQRGNEWNNRLETLAGYTIEKNKNGWWVYSGKTHHGKNGLRVGIEEPAGKVLRHFDGIPRPVPEGAGHPVGLHVLKAPASRSVLVLLVQFTDRTSLGTTPGQWAQRIFYEKGNSLADFYRELSGDQVSLSAAAETHGVSNDGVVGWLTLNYPHPGTGANTGEKNRQLTRDAILAADSDVDFLSFDTNRDGYVSSMELGIIVVAAGFETGFSRYGPGVWSHHWSLDKNRTAPVCDGVKVGAWMGGADARTGGYIQFGEWHQSNAENGHMATIGKMAHEWGHFAFDLPDQDELNGAVDENSRFRLMGTGAWGKLSQNAHPGRNPAQMGPWSREFCGLGTPGPRLNNNELSTVTANLCWTQDHTPPGHTHSGSLYCWSYGVIKAFKSKYSSKFSSCDPSQGTAIDLIPSTYFSTYTYYSPSSLQSGDLIGTGSSGISHIAYVNSVYYPYSEYSVTVSDANRFSSHIVRTSSLYTMLDDRNESATKVYRAKSLVFPPTTSPSLNSPDSGSYINTTHTLQWSGSGFNSYTLMVDDNYGFPSPTTYTNAGTSKTFTLSPGSSLYWKVRGHNDCGAGPYSSYEWVGIATTCNPSISAGSHGPYTVMGDVVRKLSVTFSHGFLHDVSYVKIYKKLGSGSWQYLTTVYSGSLPYTYNAPEIIFRNNLPVKSGPMVYYKGDFYGSSGRYVTGSMSTCYYEELY